MTEPTRAAFRSDVNVGGPDGPAPGEPPECTVGTIMVAYVEPDGTDRFHDARMWLWNELDNLRNRYEVIWLSQ